MNKITAKNADRFLLFISKNIGLNHAFDASLVSKFLTTETSISKDEIASIFALLLKDGFIDFIRHPNAPTHNFGVYNLTLSGHRFIKFDGGYTRQRQFESWQRTNVRFTWIRHWVWFFTSVISVGLNIYFIFFRE